EHAVLAGQHLLDVRTVRQHRNDALGLTRNVGGRGRTGRPRGDAFVDRGSAAVVHYEWRAFGEMVARYGTVYDAESDEADGPGHGPNVSTSAAFGRLLRRAAAGGCRRRPRACRLRLARRLRAPLRAPRARLLRGGGRPRGFRGGARS